MSALSWPKSDPRVGVGMDLVPDRKRGTKIPKICTPKAAIDRNMYYFTAKMTKTLMQLLKWPALRYIVL